MTRHVKIAAVQMNAEPAPAADRLARAETLIAQAAAEGAQLIVLPELFNTGYEYSEANYRRAEPADGPTPAWMKETAARRNVHLAGSFFLLDYEDIYNSLWLVAPDGRVWRYDKIYPWTWERGYFREGHSITVADTGLGKFGLLVCWDIAHPELWERYAGRVEAMLISSCPPRVHDLTLHLPEGNLLTTGDAGPVMRHIKRTSDESFGLYLRRQAMHLGVPVVNTTGTGAFRTAIPMPKTSLLIYTLARPDLWKYISLADTVIVEAGFFNETYIADANGNVLQQVPPEMEGYALAEVALPESPPRPAEKQPRYGISAFVYRFDELANVLLAPVYRREVRRAYGQQMAPVSRQTKMWRAAMVVAVVLAFLLGLKLGAGRKR